MFEWLRRRRPAGRTLVLRSRGDFSGTIRVDFSELAPESRTFLAHTAYVQLSLSEMLSDLVAQAPDATARETFSRAAAAALSKHRRLVELIEERGDDAEAEMLRFRQPLEAFRDATHGVRPEETMLTVHLSASMLTDFAIALAAGYGDVGRRAARVLRTDDATAPLVDALRAAIGGDGEVADLLSLWGRRIVGDTLLVARRALRPSPVDGDDRIEPVFTALVSAHGRRMDLLGLAA